MAKLFATSKQLISHHIANILKENELNKISVVKQYLTTAAKFIFATSKTNISMHIANLLKEKELIKNAVVKFFLTTAVDGKKNRGTRR